MSPRLLGGGCAQEVNRVWARLDRVQRGCEQGVDGVHVGVKRRALVRGLPLRSLHCTIVV